MIKPLQLKERRELRLRLLYFKGDEWQHIVQRQVYGERTNDPLLRKSEKSVSPMRPYLQDAVASKFTRQRFAMQDQLIKLAARYDVLVDDPRDRRYSHSDFAKNGFRQNPAIADWMDLREAIINEINVLKAALLAQKDRLQNQKRGFMQSFSDKALDLRGINSLSTSISSLSNESHWINVVSLKLDMQWLWWQKKTHEGMHSVVKK